MKPSAKLRETIDRMVEESIRRILPDVMNEVLLRTVASAGIVGEGRRPSRPQNEASPPRKNRPKAVTQGRRLSELLDEGAGAEFYGEAEPETSSEVPISSRIAALPQGLQALAEDVDTSMHWDEGSFDPDGGPVQIRDPGRAIGAAGLDMSRMLATIKATSKPKGVVTDSPDRDALLQFEQKRLERERIRLNDGKPVE